MNVFEFGSGNSSLWWARKAKSVVSVEDDERWYKKISEEVHSRSLGKRIRYILEENKEKYIHALDDNHNDTVVIDGSHRPKCSEHVFRHYEKCGGGVMIVFDNSDWYPKTIKKIHEKLNWFQIDFHGFGPINSYTWTTTIFVNPEMDTHIKYSTPLKSTAGLIQNVG